jgi:hypothetical protein
MNAKPGETLKDAYLRNMKEIRAQDPTGKDPAVKAKEQELNAAFKKITDAGIKDTITAMNKDPGMWTKIKEIRDNVKAKVKGTATMETPALPEEILKQ